MEADEAQTDDSSNYYGGLKVMGVIDRQVSSLILALQESPEYREYRRQEKRLQKNPELKERVDQFRRENYVAQGNSLGEDWEEVIERLDKESSHLRKIPEVNAYLDAELALCRLIQRTVSKITAGIAMDIPL